MADKIHISALSELSELLDDELKIEAKYYSQWIHPKNLDGIDFDKSKQINFDFYYEFKDLEQRSDDEIIVDYLKQYLRAHEEVSKDADFQIIDLIEAAVFLIVNCWSYAAVGLGFCGNQFLHGENVQECLSLVKTAYHQTSVEFVKENLRELAIDLLNYDGISYAFSDCLDDQTNAFLIELFAKIPADPYQRLKSCGSVSPVIRR